MAQQNEQQKQRRQQQEQSEASDGCDESKCVSTGLGHLRKNSFTCYGDGEYYPMMCADGYQARVVEEESPISDNYPHWAYWQDGEVLTQYFTCCPPDLSAENNVTRHCSNPVATTDDNNNISMICNDDVRQHSRQMKPNMDLFSGQLVQSYMCCDSIIANDSNTTTDFLDETQCVPYHDEFYRSLLLRNKYSAIAAITCDFSDGEFQFSRRVEIYDPLSTVYECCKTGPALPPFIQDSAFKLTIYPIIAFYSIAAVSSIILILGLSIPLLIQLKNGTAQLSQRTSRRTEPGFSPYNLYLVYLAIPDLIYSLYVLGLYGSYINQEFNPEFYGAFIFPGGATSNSHGWVFYEFYALSNLYLNAIISYQVFILLRNSHQMRSSNPPGLLKVTMQAAAVYFFAILVSIVYYFIVSAASKARDKGDYERAANISSAIGMFVLFLYLLLLPAFGVVGYVCIIIWHRGNMPSMDGIIVRDKALRTLVWYFFRIIAVFGACWLPTLILASFSTFTGIWWSYPVAGLISALQPILSTAVAMTKSDVKKYIVDLITLSYIRTTESQQPRNSEELYIGTAPVEAIHTGATRTSSVTTSIRTKTTRSEATSSMVKSDV
jgi:hypothetical protein